jgi:hypothetical protein
MIQTDGLIGFSHRSRPHANEGERVTRKPRVVTFRLDQATWDRMRELVPYTKYGNASSFIREGHRPAAEARGRCWQAHDSDDQPEGGLC